MNRNTNLVRIKAVDQALAHLGRSVVFVGGATLELYVDRGAPEIRPTEDVDVLIELWAYKDFAAVEERLRKNGFINDTESRVVCRFKLLRPHEQDPAESRLTVDIVATGENVLGFTNRWYAEGFTHATDYVLEEHHTIKILTAPYFIASKIEAFQSNSRAFHHDGFQSRDFEDIIFVLEYRLAIWDELRTSPVSVREYLKTKFSELLKHPRFEEWVDAHAGWGSPPATYYIIDEMEKFVSEKE